MDAPSFGVNSTAFSEWSGKPTETDWPDSRTNRQVTVVKLAPSGRLVTEYPGEVVATDGPGRWLAVRATWTNKLVVLDGLEFHPGDILLEYFSPDEWFNVFAVYTPDGTLRGWYANVTFPTRYDPLPDPPRLVWHDLFIDLIAVPGAPPSVRDEDELAEANIAASNPRLHAHILAGREAILSHLRAESFPFVVDPIHALGP